MRYPGTTRQVRQRLLGSNAEYANPGVQWVDMGVDPSRGTIGTNSATVFSGFRTGADPCLKCEPPTCSSTLVPGPTVVVSLSLER